MPLYRNLNGMIKLSHLEICCKKRLTLLRPRTPSVFFYGHLFKSTDRLHFQYVCCGSSPTLFWKIQSGVVEILEDQQGPTKLRSTSLQFLLTLYLLKTYLKRTLVIFFLPRVLTDTYSDCFTCS